MELSTRVKCDHCGLCGLERAISQLCDSVSSVGGDGELSGLVLGRMGHHGRAYFAISKSCALSCPPAQRETGPPEPVEDDEW